MGQDCLWDSDEKHSWAEQSILCFAPCCSRGSLFPYQNEEQISCAVHSQSCSSLSQRQSCPIPKWGASVLWGSPYGENCVRDAFLYYKKVSDTEGVNSTFEFLGSSGLIDQYLPRNFPCSCLTTPASRDTGHRKLDSGQCCINNCSPIFCLLAKSTSPVPCQSCPPFLMLPAGALGNSFQQLDGVYCRTAVQQYTCTAVQLYSCSAVLLYCCTAV